jgi:TRAP-type mannitol/chloroaromatic compound transport system substrate-binding protein
MALDYAKLVNDMTGGDLKTRYRRRRGARVGLIDAVSKGTLDGGHGVLVYHYGSVTALALWGRARPMRWMPTCCWPAPVGRRQELAKAYASLA